MSTNYIYEVSPNNGEDVFKIKDAEAAPISLLKDTVGWVGKNKLPLTLDLLKTLNTNGTWSGNVYSYQGIAYTVSIDSYGYITEIDVHGTATAESALKLFVGTCAEMYRYNGQILSGVVGAAASTYRQLIYLAESPYTYYASQRDDEVVVNNIPNTSSPIQYRFVVDSGISVSHAKFKPMIRDASITDSTYEPYHPSVEDSKFDRAEQRVLGAKNWYSSNNGRIVTENGATYELSSTGVRVYTTANKSYGNIQIPQILNKNTAFIVTGALDWVSGVARMQVRGSNDGSTWTAIAESSDWTSDRNVELSFNSGNYNYYHLRVWCTRDTAEIGDITLSNLMIRLASDPDDTYAPPAMTNLELTDAFPTSYSTSGLTYTNCTYVAGGYYKIGKVCFFNIRIKTKSDLATSDDVYIAGLPTYSGISNTVVVTGFGYSSLSEVTINKPVVLYTNGNLKLSHSLTANSDYIVNGFYLCD